MPSFLGGGRPKVSQLVVDADLDLGATYKLLADVIQHSSGAGSLALKDSGGNTVGSFEAGGLVFNKVLTDEITDQAGTGMVDFLTGLKVDHIAELTATHRVLFDNWIEPTQGIFVTSNRDIYVDRIREATASNDIRFSHPIRVDTIKEVTASNKTQFVNGLKVDHIAEYTASHNVVIDNGVDAQAGLTIGYAAGSSYPVYYDNEEKTTASTTYIQCVGTFIAPTAATYRFLWNLKSNNASYTASSLLYKNGGAAGTAKTTTSTSYQAQSDDLVLAQGDRVDLYFKTSNASGICYVDEFQIGSAYRTPSLIMPRATDAL